MLEPHEAEALDDLLAVAEHHDLEFMLIGATARLVAFDRPSGVRSTRTTRDCDLVVRSGARENIERFKEVLTRGPDARFTRVGEGNTFVHDNGVEVQLLSLVHSADGAAILGDEGTLDPTGYDEAFSQAGDVRVAAGRSLKVLSVPVFVALKLFTFADRRLLDDLRDVFFVLEHYGTAGNEERIFDELAEELSSGDLEFDLAAAYLCGMDVGRALAMPSSRALREVLEGMLGDDDPAIAALTRSEAAAFDPDSTWRRTRLVRGILEAFAGGLVRAS